MGEIKVLHCLNAPAWGGLEIYASELIGQLQKTGIQQAALCSPDSRAAEELPKMGVEVILLPTSKTSKWTQAGIIRALIQEKDFTHLHAHTRLDMWAGALAKWNWSHIRLIYNLYMNALPKQDLVHKWLFSKVDALCTSSQNILNDAKRNFPIAPEKLHLVRYGRNTAQYQHNAEKALAIRQQYHVTPEQLVLGTLCRIDPGKGVKELVSALEFLSDAELQGLQLWIIGEPTIIQRHEDGTIQYEAPSLELAQWIDKKSNEPRYKGHLVRIPFQKDYIPYLDALDFFALASYNETYSLSVLDAMLMEKPVIGTRAGGTPEQIGNDERGTLVEPKDAKSITQGIRAYLGKHSKIQEQGSTARLWVLENHCWETTLAKTTALYLERISTN